MIRQRHIYFRSAIASLLGGIAVLLTSHAGAQEPADLATTPGVHSDLTKSNPGIILESPGKLDAVIDSIFFLAIVQTQVSKGDYSQALKLVRKARRELKDSPPDDKRGAEVILVALKLEARILEKLNRIQEAEKIRKVAGLHLAGYLENHGGGYPQVGIRFARSGDDSNKVQPRPIDNPGDFWLEEDSDNPGIRLCSDGTLELLKCNVDAL